MFARLLQRLPPLNLPSVCAVCHRWPAQPVCESCVTRFALPQHRCARCALPLATGVPCCGACLLHPPPLDACYAALDYAYPWSDLIADFKFHQAPGWAGVLAQRLRATPGVAAALQAADGLIPLPLSNERLRERGYNQALELCKALERRKTRSDLLLRIQHTAAQTGLDRAARERNVRHAFAPEPLRRDDIAARHWLLVDDVMTSGASLYSAARALRQAGARRVDALVLARTPTP